MRRLAYALSRSTLFNRSKHPFDSCLYSCLLTNLQERAKLKFIPLESNDINDEVMKFRIPHTELKWEIMA